MITFAYLTHEDVQRIPMLKEQTVIVIKGPAGTKLEVPHPKEVRLCESLSIIVSKGLVKVPGSELFLVTTKHL